METVGDHQARPNQQDIAQEHYQEGLNWWKQKKIDKALHHFQKAYDLFPENLYISSYLGVTLAKAGIMERGIQLCQKATSKRPFNEDFLYNLGQAYLFAGKRMEARKTFLLGAKGCSETKRFVGALLQMGVRRKPVIRFLPRNHFLNRWLGKLTYRPEAARVQDIEN